MAVIWLTCRPSWPASSLSWSSVTFTKLSQTSNRLQSSAPRWLLCSIHHAQAIGPSSWMFPCSLSSLLCVHCWWSRMVVVAINEWKHPAVLPFQIWKSKQIASSFWSLLYCHRLSHRIWRLLSYSYVASQSFAQSFFGLHSSGKKILL